MKTKPTSRIIPFIPGDGIGPEIMDAAKKVINAAVLKAYGDPHLIEWKTFHAGQIAFDETGEWLPESTLAAIKLYKVAIKGPLTTPIGGGMRSLNVTLRQTLDLYVCLRPVRWIGGLPSPHKDPRGIDIVIFRENTEDLYTGIEYQVGTADHAKWMSTYQQALPDDYARLPYPQVCGIGIKPISEPNSKRLVRAALQYTIENNRKRLTLVHKGNIMKFTEGAFLRWGYDEIEACFSDSAITHRQFLQWSQDLGKQEAEKKKNDLLTTGKIWVDDVIADVVFEQLITRPQNFDVIATTNLNGDYLSDAAAALAGGVGIAPGANINSQTGVALFEANHGSAQDLAGKDKANPSSLILSGEMMLRFIGWDEAADLIRMGVSETIHQKKVTFDLAAQIEGADALGTHAFADKIISIINK